MKPSKTIDCLIIGQGLSGSILAWLLEQQGQRVLIVDRAGDRSASRIAAGIVNPVAGQRLVKHPRVETCLATARALYSTLGDTFQQPFYFERPMVRLFQSDQERTIWAARNNDPCYRPYLGEHFDDHAAWPAPANRHGGFYQKECGWLDAPRFLDAMRTHFESKQQLVESDFSWNELSTKKNSMLWNGRPVGRIIACEGFAAGQNPYFSWLPFQFSKGQILTLKADRDLPDRLVNHGKWLLPLSTCLFKCGATYEWKNLDRQPSTAAAKLLDSAARALLPHNTRFRMLAHEAGIRPGSLDKNPFAGLHPTHGRIGIFNGFGSKGVLTIPYYAECFVEHLLQGANLPKEIDIARSLAQFRKIRA